MIFISIMWDDGLVSDLKILEIIRKLNITSTFAISPSRHAKNRSPNDKRGDYGMLVSRQELREFSDFEICNHGNLHLDLSKSNYKQTKEEIESGKKNLEDIYQKEISGFCYPYGVYTDVAKNILLDNRIKYARTTQLGLTKSHLLLNPNFKWNKVAINKIQDNSNLIIWGHTYELKTDLDWKVVRSMYEEISSNCNIKIIKFEEMVCRLCC